MKPELKDLNITLNVSEQSVVLHALKTIERKSEGDLKTAANDLISHIQTAQIEANQ